MFILITHLIFKISKENRFNCVYFYFILLINLENNQTILIKFLIHRHVISIIFRKVYNLNRFEKINHLIVLITCFFQDMN